MTRLHARAPRNERARGSAPCGHWRRLTVLGALSGEGMVAAMSIEAATTTQVFLAFLRAVLVPELRRRHPNATVLMDNLPAHKPRAVETVLTEAGFKLLCLPRYSPDLSPIEPGWSKTKSALRATEARTPEALDAALASALDSITPADARGWFNHCGYPFPNSCENRSSVPNALTAMTKSGQVSRKEGKYTSRNRRRADIEPKAPAMMFMWSLSVVGKVGIDIGPATVSVSSWSCRGRLSRHTRSGRRPLATDRAGGRTRLGSSTASPSPRCFAIA